VNILVSSCLVGIHTQWNEGCNKIDDIVELVKAGRAVFMCPEQLGGLTTPREWSEIERGKTARDVLEGNAKVVTRTGRDVTQQYVRGAQRMLAFCQEFGIETAILQSSSPACGSMQTLDGTYSGATRPGKGIAAELLAQNGIQVYNEVNYRDKI